MLTGSGIGVFCRPPRMSAFARNLPPIALQLFPGLWGASHNCTTAPGHPHGPHCPPCSRARGRGAVRRRPRGLEVSGERARRGWRSAVRPDRRPRNCRRPGGDRNPDRVRGTCGLESSSQLPRALEAPPHPSTPPARRRSLYGVSSKACNCGCRAVLRRVDGQGVYREIT